MNKIMLAALLASSSIASAFACTRTLYVADDKTVITGRNMDWQEDMKSNLYLFPAGMERDGASGPKSIAWTSKYGSVIVAGYEAGSTDGMNEKGLVANLLYLAIRLRNAEGERPLPVNLAPGAICARQLRDGGRGSGSLARRALLVSSPQPCRTAAPRRCTCRSPTPAATLAIFEYVDGKLVIHHGKQYNVMTNSPAFDQQLALNAYWKGIGGLTFLPGTNCAADRFARRKAARRKSILCHQASFGSVVPTG